VVVSARRAAGRAGGSALLLLVVATVLAAAAPPRERPPAVADRFYPADRAGLEAAVRGFVARATAPRGARPLAIVAPHAGYVFCGAVLGEAWAQARDRDYDVIVLLGTNHTAPGFAGAAVWPAGAFRTPLGAAAVDAAAARALLDAGAGCVDEPRVHAREHSIEVQVPFAQVLYPGVPILPLVVGDDEPGACARLGRALAAALAGRRPLIVASSDLSHYPRRADAAAVDRAVLAAVASLDPAAVRREISAQMRRDVPGLATCACGEAPILVAMAAARALGATRGDVVAYANSAEVPAGDPARVVGYGAVAFRADAPTPPSPATAPAGDGALSARERRALLALARETIAARLAGREPPPPADCAGALGARRGAFVTLKIGGELRGCIGHMAEDLPLCEAVRAMALAAAFQDRRFAPLAPGELPRCTIEISALTPARPVAGPDGVVIGRDGVVLRKAGRSAVFLPQVATEQGWDRETFLSQLARKAGLPADAWREGAGLLTFRAEVFGEADPR